MWLQRIVEINKPIQFRLPMNRISEVRFLMPHLHSGEDNPLCFIVGLRAGNLSKFLSNIVLTACLNKCMGSIALIFFAIVRINVVNLVRILRQYRI